MKVFELFHNGNVADFLVEEEAFPGTRRVTKKVMEDVRLVTDVKPEILQSLQECVKKRIVIVGTIGKSPIIDGWIREGKIKTGNLYTDREVFSFQVVNACFGVALCIVGSDKRGTNYGLFHLSNLCGVSPLVYWGDAVANRKSEICLSFEKPYFSSQPSVKYRGFFINDEWPAFGKWCTDTFGGINAKAYDKVFELLLRLKGNYLWPAMWKSSFSQDGPGLESAELADEYGIIMGTSHHEPLCRAGVEWQQQYQQYGTDNTWSFIKNQKAITSFWRDGLLRNRIFENVMTVGMRGEDDSKLLPEDSSLSDNIEVVKKAVCIQNELIREIVNEDLKEVPRMIAIYKEVEDFFYGDENCMGLKDWEELKDVIFLLSDDNHGNLRTLPDDETRKHPGGFGMYYHLDYHGAPVSYEWQNSTKLAKIWEQMTMAYEYGIRDMWIVNVGDLKGNEFPLCYFMDLAYDYDTWGIKAINKTDLYTEQWIHKQFGNLLNTEQYTGLQKVLEEYVGWNSVRRPEAMNAEVYHPIHFNEGQRIREQLITLLEVAEELHKTLPDYSMDAYESMIYYPAKISLALVCMNIEAGYNHHLAKRGSLAANMYGKSVRERICDTERWTREYHKMQNGKWNHMMESAHTGFRNWDDNDWVYPTVHQVMPIPYPKVLVGFSDSDTYHLGKHWQDGTPNCNDKFTRPDTKKIQIYIDSRGSVSFQYRVKCDCEWLEFSRSMGEVEVKGDGRSVIDVFCRRELLEKDETATVWLDIFFDNGSTTQSVLQIQAAPEKNDVHGFVESNGVIAMEAEHFYTSLDADGAKWQRIHHLGRRTDGMKCFPVSKDFSDKEEKPGLVYRFGAKRDDDYRLIFYLAPRNPVKLGEEMTFSFAINGGKEQKISSIDRDYFTEWQNDEWNYGVMNHIRMVATNVPVKKGENELVVYAGEPGIVLDRIVLHSCECDIQASYLGPNESYYTLE